ncbi:uncharacterized protein LOC124705951 [Lolium rigidum]|uniref:uncharacterized protein LOC124705951 n=1 Tax=Lolium rigidum TaxID=89674 RepID=UPI001F5C0F8A|nr:uncharacterized protein LOC124705951 [Lolium rigidum]
MTRDQAKRLVQQENLRFRLPAQATVGALPVFQIPAQLTPPALQLYSNARRLYNLQTYQLKLDVQLPGGVVQVPVTPAHILKLEDMRHFLVQIRGGDSIVRIAVDETNGYSVAFQEVRDTDIDLNIVPWCQLKDSGHLPSKFLSNILIDYDVSYTLGLVSNSLLLSSMVPLYVLYCTVSSS